MVLLVAPFHPRPSRRPPRPVPPARRPRRGGLFAGLCRVVLVLLALFGGAVLCVWLFASWLVVWLVYAGGR